MTEETARKPYISRFTQSGEKPSANALTWIGQGMVMLCAAFAACLLILLQGCGNEDALPPVPKPDGVTVIPAWGEITNAAAVKKTFRSGETMRADFIGPGAVLLPVDFTMEKPPLRANWDINITCDLLSSDGVQFDFYCDDLSLFSAFTCYFKSGDGWYNITFCPEEAGGWQRVKVRKSQAVTEGAVAGWSNISGIRISGWRTAHGKARCAIANLAFDDGGRADAAVVFAESIASAERGTAAAAQRHAERVTNALRALGLSVAFTPDRMPDIAVTTNAAAVFLPYNPEIPTNVIAVLSAYSAAGGKLFFCGPKKNPAASAIPGAHKLPDASLGYLGFVDMPFLRSVIESILPELSEKMKSHAAAEARRAEELRDWLAKRPSRKGEFRAFWCHSARGLGGTNNWDSSVRQLRENGFNAILPNLCWAGTAFYRSDVLPQSSDVVRRGDAFDACRAACRKYGVQMHVWKVCWNMGHHVQASFVAKMKEAGRTQIDCNGAAKDKWLCPSHPDNQKLEIEAMVELAKKGPDGIHFDYIRYPDNDCCFCAGCRERFEAACGEKASNWPSDVCAEGPLKEKWNTFRRDCITKVVRSVAERVRKEAPGVKISAALFGTPSAASSVAQDWQLWCREGLLDFACPMDYVAGVPPFRSQVSAQCKAMAGVAVYPGIGLSCWPNDGCDAERLAKQIQVVRDLELKGFTVFNFDRRAMLSLPLMRLGVTSVDP